MPNIRELSADEIDFVSGGDLWADAIEAAKDAAKYVFRLLTPDSPSTPTDPYCCGHVGGDGGIRG